MLSYLPANRIHRLGELLSGGGRAAPAEAERRPQAFSALQAFGIPAVRAALQVVPATLEETFLSFAAAAPQRDDKHTGRGDDQ